MTGKAANTDAINKALELIENRVVAWNLQIGGEKIKVRDAGKLPLRFISHIVAMINSLLPAQIVAVSKCDGIMIILICMPLDTVGSFGANVWR
jgi:hypothetical protein